MDRIKESFDSLPIAVCFFDKNGVVRLINHRMLAVASQLRKGGIQTLAELHDALRSPPPTVRCLDPQLYIFRFSDGTELRFAEESIKTAAGLTYIRRSPPRMSRSLCGGRSICKRKAQSWRKRMSGCEGCLSRCRRLSGRKRPLP